MAVKLGEMLIKAGLLTPQKLQEALEYQKSNGGKLGFNLVKLSFVKEEDITRVLSQQYVVPVVASEVAIKDSIDRYYGSVHALELKKVMDEIASEEQADQNLELLEEE